MWDELYKLRTIKQKGLFFSLWGTKVRFWGHPTKNMIVKNKKKMSGEDREDGEVGVKAWPQTRKRRKCNGFWHGREWKVRNRWMEEKQCPHIRFRFRRRKLCPEAAASDWYRTTVTPVSMIMLLCLSSKSLFHVETTTIKTRQYAN